MGGSTREVNDFEGIWPDEATKYFVKTVENWRDSMKKELGGEELNKFYLFAHGFSANIAGWYALEYP